jgi:glycosyltransferase involved in cell wall biosynthesis
VIEVDERAARAPSGGAPAGRRRKALIVTNCLPGYDAGFAKSGHAHYLESFVRHLGGRDVDTVLVVLAPRVDFLRADASQFGFRVVSRALRYSGEQLVVCEPRAAVAAATWLAYARMPRGLQAVAGGLRNAARRARGYAHVLGAFADPDDREFVARTVARERPDLIVYDGIFNACGRFGSAEHWVLTHEVKYQRARSFAERGVPVFPADFSADTERAILADIGNVIAIQWDDGAEFARLLPDARVVVVPVTMDLLPPGPRSAAEAARCVFVGSGSFHNVDGIRWFLAACWPRIRAAVPHATLDIFGTVCYRLGELPAGVTAHGVADALAPAYGRAALAIVPLQIGSGLKVKLIEALAHGMPVVTTSVGAQGLSSFAPQPFLLADAPADFAAACVRVMSDSQLAAHLSSAALECAQRFTPVAAFAEFTAATATDATPTGPAEARVCVAVPTFRRPVTLDALLTGLVEQRVAAGTSVEVVVLDNDPAGSAAELVAARQAGFPFALHYEHVAQAGLAMVRNRALTFAAERFTHIAMIDDDEVPAADWLAHLVRAAEQSGADAVVGPVEPILDAGAPPWIRDLRARETPRHPDGALLRDGWSCNALVSTAAVARLHLAFDPALNFAGGEDQLFFRQLLAAGGSIAFAAGAGVRESLAAERLTVRFNLRRAFRRGNSLSFCERRLNPTARMAAVRSVKAAALIGLGLLRMPVGAARDESALVRYACDIARGAGMLAGLVGRTYEAYARD